MISLTMSKPSLKAERKSNCGQVITNCTYICVRKRSKILLSPSMLNKRSNLKESKTRMNGKKHAFAELIFISIMWKLVGSI